MLAARQHTLAKTETDRRESCYHLEVEVVGDGWAFLLTIRAGGHSSSRTSFTEKVLIKCHWKILSVVETPYATVHLIGGSCDMIKIILRYHNANMLLSHSKMKVVS